MTLQSVQAITVNSSFPACFRLSVPSLVNTIENPNRVKNFSIQSGKLPFVSVRVLENSYLTSSIGLILEAFATMYPIAVKGLQLHSSALGLPDDSLIRAPGSSDLLWSNQISSGESSERFFSLNSFATSFAALNLFKDNELSYNVYRDRFNYLKDFVLNDIPSCSELLTSENLSDISLLGTTMSQLRIPSFSKRKDPPKVIAASPASSSPASASSSATTRDYVLNDIPSCSEFLTSENLNDISFLGTTMSQLRIPSFSKRNDPPRVIAASAASSSPASASSSAITSSTTPNVVTVRPIVTAPPVNQNSAPGVRSTTTPSASVQDKERGKRPQPESEDNLDEILLARRIQTSGLSLLIPPQVKPTAPSESALPPVLPLERLRGPPDSS
ncbi:uncharacterized serine-rich protein C215.13-like [Cornus florida]|uniref:uncharacterized serine-rich protein C215.13-like n=1 Tax=Cornus florida TaxID=4283 RepID=UPI00289987BB|nr:uncharacterized serine-rich protein C215.13-like [Cornus florida]